jgi:hypothetical protein
MKNTIKSIGPTEWATAYAELLIKAAEVAGKLTKAYVR